MKNHLNYEPVTLPHFDMYEAGQLVVRDFMEERNVDMHYIADEIDVNVDSLYKQLNPKDLNRPLHADVVMKLTKLTGDMRIIEAMAGEFDKIVITKRDGHADIKDINLLVDMANIENGDVFRVVKQAILDNEITVEERQQILKEIEEAQKANAELKELVISIAIEGKGNQ